MPSYFSRCRLWNAGRRKVSGEFDVDEHIRRVRENPFRVVFDRKTGAHVSTPVIIGERLPTPTAPPDTTSIRRSASPRPTAGSPSPNPLPLTPAPAPPEGPPGGPLVRRLLAEIHRRAASGGDFATLATGVPFWLAPARDPRGDEGFEIRRSSGSRSFVSRALVERLAALILEGKPPASLITDDKDRYVLAALSRIWDQLKRQVDAGQTHVADVRSNVASLPPDEAPPARRSPAPAAAASPFNTVSPNEREAASTSLNPANLATLRDELFKLSATLAATRDKMAAESEQLEAALGRVHRIAGGARLTAMLGFGTAFLTLLGLVFLLLKH